MVTIYHPGYQSSWLILWWILDFGKNDGYMIWWWRYWYGNMMVMVVNHQILLTIILTTRMIGCLSTTINLRITMIARTFKINLAGIAISFFGSLPKWAHCSWGADIDLLRDSTSTWTLPCHSVRVFARQGIESRYNRSNPYHNSVHAADAARWQLQAAGAAGCSVGFATFKWLWVRTRVLVPGFWPTAHPLFRDVITWPNGRGGDRYLWICSHRNSKPRYSCCFQVATVWCRGSHDA